MEMLETPTYHLTTYGCQMNKNDSERIAGLLSSLGFQSTDHESQADLVVINTCSVRQSAEDRVFGSQEKYLAYKKCKPNMIVAVTGCMPGRDTKGAFRSRLPATDLYFPMKDLVHLPTWIAELRPDLVNSSSIRDDYLKIRPLRVPSAQAYVTVQTGCNKFCTYCVVPFSRGLEQNRPLADIVEECRDLAMRGVREITLLGQTVNSYVAPCPHAFSPSNPYRNHFAGLLWEVNQIPGIERLHWTAAHPLSMTDEVIDALSLPAQINYVHLPAQSGSNEVLRRMNRKYTREQYLAVIERMRRVRPQLAMGTDIIVGFSGETREQFEETVSLYRDVNFDISYHAQYSPRSGTLGVKLFADDVSREEKRARWDVLQVLMEETTLRKNQAYVGKNVEVLVEQVKDGWAQGHTREFKMARFPTQKGSLCGTSVLMHVNVAQTWVLFGQQMTV